MTELNLALTVVGALVLLIALAFGPLLRRNHQVSGAGDALFLSWFGPIGVAAIFYATLAAREAGSDEAWVVGSMIICASVLIYGVSAAPLTNFYARRFREVEQ